jgi:hypothetical protein
VGFQGIGILFRIGFRDLDRIFLRTCTVFLRIGFGSVWFHRSGFLFFGYLQRSWFFRFWILVGFLEDGFLTGFQGIIWLFFPGCLVFLGSGWFFRIRFGFSQGRFFRFSKGLVSFLRIGSVWFFRIGFGLLRNWLVFLDCCASTEQRYAEVQGRTRANPPDLYRKYMIGF